ncbi:MAG: FkbM family methyltransferase [Anaerolineales bacterium]|jgi:FkbM family methyltransferase
MVGSSLLSYYGLFRSILRYYGIPFRIHRLTHFYAQFIRPGDLCFDIGSHLGNRILAWSRLGARIVAVEPQPVAMKFLKMMYHKRSNVILVESALGAEKGDMTLFVDPRNPTVATLSLDWIMKVRLLSSFSKERWSTTLTVPVTTLSELINQYGQPSFCKIDVEGFEYEVLKGINRPLTCLSFEYIPAAIETALACISRLCYLGEYRFQWSIGENPSLSGAGWFSGEDMADWLRSLSPADPSGDIYARLQEM